MFGAEAGDGVDGDDGTDDTGALPCGAPCGDAAERVSDVASTCATFPSLLLERSNTVSPLHSNYE